MKVKNVVKKIAAFAAGATLVGATILGAVAAADLGAYPAPFITDNAYNAKIVVGANAATMDVIGATDIAAGLQVLSYIETEVVTGGGTTVVEDGEVEDDLYFGVNPFSAAKTYDNGEISILEDAKVRYNSENHDFKETIQISADALTAQSGGDHEEYGIEPYIEVTGADTDIYYRWTPDTAITLNFTADDSLDIEFLGMDLEITAAGTNRFTLSTATEVWLNSGETLTVDVGGEEYTIEIANVYDAEAIITVNGLSDNLGEGDTKDYDYADFELELIDAVNDDGTENDAVKIKYGSTTSETAIDTHAAEMLGYGDQTTEAEWVWDISGNATALNWIGVEYHQTRNQIESELTTDWELPALALGDKIVFPNDYATIEFANTKYHETGREVFTVTADESNGNWYNEDSEAVFTSADYLIRFRSADGSDIFQVDSNSYKEVIFEKAGGQVGLVDSSGDNTNTTVSLSMLTVKVDDLSKYINVTSSAGNVTSDLALVTIYDIENNTGVAGTPTGDVIWTLDWDKDDDPVTADLSITGSNIGTRDYDFMTDYGVIVYEPKSRLEDDYGYLEFSFPTEGLTYDLVVSASESSTTGGSTTTKEIVPITNVAVLDTETEVGQTNLIVVGGPCANSIAYALMGNDVCNEGFSEGKGLIKMWETGDYMAIMVAGWEAGDTLIAVDVIVNYADYAEDFAGNAEVEVLSADKTVTQVTVVEETTDDTTDDTTGDNTTDV